MFNQTIHHNEELLLLFFSIVKSCLKKSDKISWSGSLPDTIKQGSSHVIFNFVINVYRKIYPSNVPISHGENEYDLYYAVATLHLLFMMQQTAP